MTALLPVFAMFFGSFLLFGIQPLLGRTLLPPFGGSAAVWTVCLAAYQVLLLVGYGYAHLLAQRSARTQRLTHLILLGLAVVWTFAFAAARLFLKGQIGNSAAPSLEVLFCVTLFVGLPYVLLSANSTLIQAWLARVAHVQGGARSEELGVGDSKTGRDASPQASAELRGGGDRRTARGAVPTEPNPQAGTLQPGETDTRSVYKLYAVSNLGSLLGLLIYPFVLEPYVSLNVQWYGFSTCLLVYAALLAAVAKGTFVNAQRSTLNAQRSDSETATADSHLPAPLARPWLWFALPAVSTFLLNAVTVHLSTDVTPVPMMWVLLLTAYLLSFIIGFSVIGEKGLIVWTVLTILTLVGAAFISGLTGGRAFLPNLTVGVLLVLIGCTCLHGWLYRIRPETRRLTHFYLGIAMGGAAGGVSASLIAPVLFTRVWEYPLSLLLASAVCAWLIDTWSHVELKGLNRILLFLCGAAFLVTVTHVVKGETAVLSRSRNFYGCLRTNFRHVPGTQETPQIFNQFYHGETLHGVQAKEGPMKQMPTTYYGVLGGGFPLQNHPAYSNAAPMRVAAVGLGIGTLACYGRTNDLYRFYEINPQVVAVATDTNLFTYLSDSAARVELSVGDARKRLEAERSQGEPLYDVMLVDAYSGDSVPFHLATREAFQLYLDRLAPGGILAIHLSNWHIDLLPLCKNMAAAFGLHATGILSGPTTLTCEATWVLLTREPVVFKVPQGAREIDWTSVRTISTPTDERGSLLSLIRFGHRAPVKEMDIDLNKVRFF